MGREVIAATERFREELEQITKWGSSGVASVNRSSGAEGEAEVDADSQMRQKAAGELSAEALLSTGRLRERLRMIQQRGPVQLATEILKLAKPYTSLGLANHVDLTTLLASY